MVITVRIFYYELLVPLSLSNIVNGSLFNWGFGRGGISAITDVGGVILDGSVNGTLNSAKLSILLVSFIKCNKEFATCTWLCKQSTAFVSISNIWLIDSTDV